jgi:hypothetical protein
MNEFRAQWMKYATSERGIRVFKAMGIVLLAITAFWFLDLPQTARLKAAIVRNSPISSHAANELINKGTSKNSGVAEFVRV